MRASAGTSLKVLFLVLLACGTFLVATYVTRRVTTKGTARHGHEGAGLTRVTPGKNVGQKSLLKPGGGGVDRRVVSGGVLQCPTLDVVDDTLEINAEANYVAMMPNVTCTWGVRIFGVDDDRKPIFEKTYSDKEVKVSVKQDHSLKLEDRIVLPHPLNAGKYKVEVALYQKLPRAKTKTAVLGCSKGIVIK